MPGVFPSVGSVIDLVGIIEYRLAATLIVVHHRILSQGDRIVTDDNGRCGRLKLDIALTMNRSVFVGHRIKVIRRNRVDELPLLGVVSAISVCVTVGHSTMTVGIHGDHWIAGIRYRVNIS